MERTKYLIVAFFFVLPWLAFCADEQQNIYNAYLKNDMATWKKMMDAMHAESGKSNERELELLNYEYGYIGWCMGNNKKSDAKIYILRGEERLKKLSALNYKTSMLYAYKSAFYGFQIGLNKTKAPFLGGKSIDAANKAVESDKNNPYGYIQLGNIEFYMPAIFGGSKKKAIEHYLKAQKLMESGAVKSDWNYLSLLTQIAKAYEELKDYKNAETYYRKILSLAPDFAWVKNELYPALLNNKKR